MYAILMYCASTSELFKPGFQCDIDSESIIK